MNQPIPGQLAYDNATDPRWECDEIPERIYDEAFWSLLEEYHKDDITDAMVEQRAIEISRGDA